jgi:two-component system NarL family response regulator
MHDPLLHTGIAICDSNEIALTGLSSALAAHGLPVRETAQDGCRARALAARSTGMVVLVDVGLRPAPESAEAVIRAVIDAGGIPVAMGVGGELDRMFEALRWGAAGYLTKDLPIDAWVHAVRAAIRGEAPLSRAMITALVAEFRNQERRMPMAELLPSARRLTQREWEVLALIADGKTNRSVACDLSISVQTVRTHVSNILAKLEAPNRSAAAAKYQQLQAVRT